MRLIASPWTLLRWVVGAVYVFALGPILITATVSFNAADQSRFPPVGFSLRWWQAALVPRWLGPLGFSVELALGAAVLAVLLGFPLAYGLTRYRFPGRDLLAALSLGPLALPAMVTGILSSTGFRAKRVPSTTLVSQRSR